MHPLDPLSAEEFRTVTAILGSEQGVGDGWRYASIELAEPTKSELAAYDTDGTPPPRRAVVVCFNSGENTTYKAFVSISGGSVDSFDLIPDVQANFTVDEFEECDRVLRAHPDVQAALAKRGITDLDSVFMDTWTYGGAVTPRSTRVDVSVGRTRGFATARVPTRTRIPCRVCTA